MDISTNIALLRQRISEAAFRAGRGPEQIKLVAVGKTVGTDRIVAAIDAGITLLGENRVQEARSKWPVIHEKLKTVKGEFHLVGHLQRNKAKEAVQLFDLIHSLDSERLALELDRRAREVGKTQRVLIEVNTSGEATKFGVKPEDAKPLIDLALKCRNLKLEGLMTVGPLYGSSIGARQCFEMLRDLQEELGGIRSLPELSMGMTQDFEEAIEEGATMIRIGTAIFGARN